MSFGNWNVDVSVGKMPQKVATAVSKLNGTMLGAEYEAIAYIGSQVVNGTNHAVLAEQVITTGRDTTNIVMLVFNEKPNENDAVLVSIDRIVEGGLPLGGTKIDVRTNLSDEEMGIWNAAFDGFVGSKMTPFALLGSHTTKGTSYIFAATVTPIAPDAVQNAVVVTINPFTKEVSFTDMLSDKQSASLKYAFTW